MLTIAFVSRIMAAGKGGKPMTIKAGTHAPCELWVNGKLIAQGTYTYCAAVWEAMV